MYGKYLRSESFRKALIDHFNAQAVPRSTLPPWGQLLFYYLFTSCIIIILSQLFCLFATLLHCLFVLFLMTDICWAPCLTTHVSSQSPSLLAGGSSSSSNTLTERLLRQNAELTGFVSRLTEEKNDLRNHTLRLEEELRRYRQSGLGSGDSVSTWKKPE